MKGTTTKVYPSPEERFDYVNEEIEQNLLPVLAILLMSDVRFLTYS